MSSNVQCSGGCLSGELFGGVLAGVVIATNFISIVLTYFITKKRLKDNQRRTNVSLENTLTIANSRTEQNRDQRNTDAPENVYPGDSEFSTDSEEENEATNPNYTHQEQHNTSSQTQNRPYHQNPSYYNIDNNSASNGKKTDNQKTDFESAQIYDEPEGFANKTQNKNSNASLTYKKNNFEGVENTAPKLPPKDDQEETDYLNPDTLPPPTTNLPLAAAESEETDYLEPEAPTTTTNAPDKPARNNTYVNQKELEEEAYEEFDHGPSLPSNPPPLVKRKPKALPKPTNFK